MNNQNWKLKYQDLKLKFHDAVDTAFRLGMEQGLQQAQVQQAQQAQADAQAAQAAAMGQQPGQPGEDPNAQMEPGQDGSELDQHINTLEGMLSQSKPGSPEQAGLQKSLAGIKSFQSDIRHKYEMNKAEQAIKAISKAIKPPFTLSKGATKNLSEPAKKALNMQEQIVADLLKSMEEEETKAKESIIKTLDMEQLLKS